MKKIICLLINFLIASCGPSTMEIAVRSSEEKKSHDVESMINLAIKKIDLIDKDCTHESTNDQCKLVKIESATSDFDMENEDKSQRILILDDNMLFTSLTRYKNRVLSHYRHSDDGQFVKYNPSIMVPKIANEIMSMFATREFISRSLLQNVGENLLKVLNNTVDQHLFGHGNNIFNNLAEYNPQAAFVIAQETFPEHIICANDVSLLKKFIDESISSILNIIHDHDIKYINLSSGADMNIFQGCNLNFDQKQKNLNILKRYYEALAGNPRTLLVQAASYVESPKDAPIDCDSISIKNRIRVGYMASLDANIDEKGESISWFKSKANFPANQVGISSCIDLVINSGIIDMRPFPHNNSPLMDSLFGLDEIPATNSTSSWVTPVALSSIIHFKNIYGPNISENISEFVRINMTKNGANKFHDPLRYKKFEVYSLKHRK